MCPFVSKYWLTLVVIQAAVKEKLWKDFITAAAEIPNRSHPQSVVYKFLLLFHLAEKNTL